MTPLTVIIWFATFGFIALAVSLVFSETVRNFALAGALSIATYSPWLHARITGFFNWARPRGIVITAIAIVILLFVWLLIPSTIFIMSIIFGSPVLGFVTAIFLAAWLFTKTFSRVWLVGPATKGIRILSLISLVIFSAWLTWDVVNSHNPLIGEYATTHIADFKISTKNGLMKASMNKGIYGKLNEDSIVYDEFLRPLSPPVNLLKDQSVRSLGQKIRRQSDDSEGLALVQIANEYGDFVSSRTGLIPIRKIDWNSTSAESSDQSLGSASEKWETVLNLPVQISGESFNEKLGPNGEEAGTGQMFFIELPAGKYSFLLYGSYRKRFDNSKWYRYSIPYSGIEHKGSNTKPFRSILYGAVVLRLGNQKRLLSGVYNLHRPTKVYVELNISREAGEYRDNLGPKVDPSNLHLKVEKEV